jgi:hypothetical protein
MRDCALHLFSRDPVLVAAYRYWDGKRAGRPMPDRRDVDPLDMPKFILPHLALIEITDDDRLKLRLVGTEIVRHHKRDNTGRCADEYLEGKYLAYVNALYAELRTKAAPMFAASRFRHPDNHVDTSRLLLPLTRGGTAVRIVLLAQIFQYGRDRRGAPIAHPLDAGSLEIIDQITFHPEDDRPTLQ